MDEEDFGVKSKRVLTKLKELAQLENFLEQCGRDAFGIDSISRSFGNLIVYLGSRGYVVPSNGASPSELIEVIKVKSAQISRLINYGQDLGYIDQYLDKGDRRKLPVRLTKRGERAYHTFVEIFDREREKSLD
ncbi:MAG: hypothetical protein Q7S74_03435 [Nanoarchaeota archaeon]|nr:hypothetical protein [Nanoarchaeota archaeon]